MEEADAAFARARQGLAAAHRRTPVVRAFMAGLAELRAEDHFSERIAAAARDEQGPAENVHRG
jgi:hypothetical protein